jgi:hypothetical protein
MKHARVTVIIETKGEVRTLLFPKVKDINMLQLYKESPARVAFGLTKTLINPPGRCAFDFLPIADSDGQFMIVRVDNV